MDLGEYLRQNEMTQEAFAQRVGTDQASVSRWISGKRFPTRSAIVAIKRATRGMVTANDFASIERAQ